MNTTDIIAEKNQFGFVKTYEVQTVFDFDNAMNELADLDAQDKEVQARYDAQREQIDKWMNDELAKTEQRRQFLQREAYAFVLDHNDDQTLKSARGSVNVRHIPASAKVADQAAAVEFAKENGLEDSVKVVETVKATELRAALGLQVAGDKVIDRNGQVVPGYAVTPASTSVTFKTIAADGGDSDAAN